MENGVRRTKHRVSLWGKKAGAISKAIVKFYGLSKMVLAHREGQDLSGTTNRKSDSPSDKKKEQKNCVQRSIGIRNCPFSEQHSLCSRDVLRLMPACKFGYPRVTSRLSPMFHVG
ncbi:hypothetical protein KM043_000765 [Ampulex compressa]|nr:hypothetical protein KM043_000765 [Ampulex compressa]